jgi:hypothetical protein
MHDLSLPSILYMTVEVNLPCHAQQNGPDTIPDGTPMAGEKVTGIPGQATRIGEMFEPRPEKHGKLI